MSQRVLRNVCRTGLLITLFATSLLAQLDQGTVTGVVQDSSAVFRGGRMAGRPAITRNRVGQGLVFYVATDCAENAFHEALARVAGRTANLSPLIAAPYGVEVTSREDSEAIYYFLLNLTETPWNGIELPRRMNNLITGRIGVTDVSLGPLQAAVLASARKADTSR